MNNKKNLERNQVKEGFDPLLQIKNNNESKNKKVKKTNENPLDNLISDNKNISIKENFQDKKIMESLFSEQNILKDTKNEKIKNFFGEENLNPIKNTSTSNNNIITINNSSVTVHNKQKEYFVNTGSQCYNAYNINFKTNFFKDIDYITKNFDIKPPETIIDYDEAFFKSEEYNLIGIIAMTDYKMLFKFRDEYMNKKLSFTDDYFKVPFFHIAKIDKTSDKKNQSNHAIEITLKDHRVLKFIILSDQMKFFANLNNFVFQKDHSHIFNFTYKYRQNIPNDLEDGWNLFNPKVEFNRQNLDFKDLNIKLKESILNKNFGLCSTYPDYLVFPSTLNDSEIKDASVFRTKNRLPTLSYFYNPANKKLFGSLWRSSQNKSGLTQSRSVHDEKLMKCIGDLGNKLVIYDARPYLAALGNRLKGGGFENADHYNCQITFCEIENIHNVRNSLNKVWQLANSTKLNENKKFWSSLESSSWYEYIHLFLKFSSDITMHLKKHNSVLIHCSDGWDRSSQILATSQLLVDPFFRTLRGFMILVEKEFLSFGHQFALRIGISQKDNHNEDQRSPIFLQWLDIIHQLLFQFPEAFEFNMELLLFLAFHYNSCLYGTFMYNCESERFEKKAKTKTVSVWTDILRNHTKYTNKKYNPIEFIMPDYSPFKMRFWEEYFFKYNTSIEKINTSSNFLIFGNNKKEKEGKYLETETIQVYKGNKSWNENKDMKLSKENLDQKININTSSNLMLNHENDNKSSNDYKEYFNDSAQNNEAEFNNEIDKKLNNNEIQINEVISETINLENEEKKNYEKSEGETNENEIESALLELIVKLSNKNLIYELDLSEETLNTIAKFKSD